MRRRQRVAGCARRLFLLALGVVLGAAFVLSSCASPTDITVLVTTDFECKDLHHVTITVGRLGAALETAPLTTLSTTCESGYAGRLVVVPSGSKDDVVAIKVVGGFGRTKQAEDCTATYDPATPGRPTYGPGCIVARRALHYTPRTPLTVPIVLRSSCAGVACGETETCVAGACLPATIADSATCQGNDGCGESALGGPGVPDAGGDAATADAGDAAGDSAPGGDASASGLQALAISAGALSPAFRAATLSYAVVPSVVTLGVPFTVTPTYASGASVSVNGAAVASGTASPVVALHLTTPTPVDVTVTSSAGAKVRYALVVPPVQEAYVKASTTRASANFGASVALSGDTLVVGAVDESSSATGINGNQSDTSAPNSGAVYVFTRSGATWSQQAYLKASNTKAQDNFGYAVALSGDTLAVLSYLESSGATGVNGNQADTSAPAAGAVYVFTRSGTTWSQQAYVKASNTRPNALFSAVALAGDTLAVGSFGESSNATGINGNQADTSASSSGAVYVFARAGTTWSQQAYLKASTTRPSMLFGYSLALSGNTLAVGSYMESSSATGINGNQADTAAPVSGAAYVFTRSGVTWSQEAYVKASNTRSNTGFGVSVSLSGDTLAVGSYGESSNATGTGGNQADTSAPLAGAAYVFTRSGTLWSQQAYIKASNSRASADFGIAVALVGDTLAVGSYAETSNATGINGNQADTPAGFAGAVYLFTRRGGTWAQQAYVKASNTRANAQFGNAFALSGDTLAVGSVGETSGAVGINGNQADTSAPLAGSVYVLR